MRIKYCGKYEKYVSRQHCEFFNDGHRCPFFSSTHWSSIRELMEDEDRPKWDVNHVIKPYNCSLIDRKHLHRSKRDQRSRRRLLSA